ncbi:MAG TPA: ABATE domain-containing protein [Candidatus Angelobacter sp.]|nr:ABATE domain-containing protein [Candidatus Angelobacter sp.]
MTAAIAPATQDFQRIAGSLALDFVNTVGNRLGDSRDYFTSISEVARWAKLAGLISPRSGLSIKPSSLTALIAVREELYATFRPVAVGAPVPRDGLERLNQRLAEVFPRRRVTRDVNGFAWAWDADFSAPEYLLGPILFDAADILISGKFRRIKQCADESCGWLFVDRSQTGKRRWCSMADCGNRYKARCFYQRRQAKR